MKTTDTIHHKWLHVLAAFVTCFYSGNVYRVAAKYWRWRLLAFVWITMMVLWSAIVFRFVEDIQPLILKQADYVINQLPTIDIKEGLARSLKKSDHAVFLPRMIQAIAVINTDDTMKNYQPKNELISIHRDGIVINRGDNKVNKIPFAKTLNVNLTRFFLRHFLLKHMGKIKHVLWAAILFQYWCIYCSLYV